MSGKVKRKTADLSEYPDLVVVYLGMRVNAIKGIKMLLGIGPQIEKAGGARPEGLLHFENGIIYGFLPLHVGMRWYWKDFASLEAWTRSEPHRRWWQDFLRDSGGTGFWHETYSMRGGMEGVFDDMNVQVGFQAFAPNVDARGSVFSARRRLGVPGIVPAPPDGVSIDE